MSSPTARTLEVLRELGYVAEVVERWVPRTKIRRDLFGCIDVLAVHPALGFLGVQATTQSNLAARVHKATAEPRLAVWLKAGASFEVWGWAKRGAQGERKLWTASRRKLFAWELAEAQPQRKEAGGG